MDSFVSPAVAAVGAAVAVLFIFIGISFARRSSDKAIEERLDLYSGRGGADEKEGVQRKKRRSAMDGLDEAMTRRGFAAKRLTVVHSRPGEVGRLAHLECRKGGGEELRVEPPVFIYDEDGGYSEAVRKLYLP